MNVTFITTKAPSLTSGSAVRNYFLVKALAESQRVSRVNLVYFSLNQNSENIPKKILNLKLFTKILPLPRRTVRKSLISYLRGRIPYVECLRENPYGALLKKITTECDVLVLSELDGYFIVEKLLQRHSDKLTIILDCHNVDYVRFKEEIISSSIFKRVLASQFIPRLKRLEISALKRADIIFACSKIDKKYFSRHVSSEKIIVIPNGAAVSVIKKEKIPPTPTILFMGLLSYGPNEDGLRFYFEKIHSLILRQLPNLQVNIIGGTPPMWLQQLGKENSRVSLMGFVPDVKQFLEKASVCICPIRYGSGTRLKILEYMAAGKAIVSTTKGCEGLDVTNNQNILIRNGAQNFANAVVNLLTDTKLSSNLGNNARKLILDKYNWKTIGDKFIDVLENILKS